MPVLVRVALVILQLDRNGAAAFGNGAAYMFELDRGVGDMKGILEHGIQAPQNDVAGRRRYVLNQHMTA